MQKKTKSVSCHTADSKPVKQGVNGTVILPPLVFPAKSSKMFCCWQSESTVSYKNHIYHKYHSYSRFSLKCIVVRIDIKQASYFFACIISFFEQVYGSLQQNHYYILPRLVNPMGWPQHHRTSFQILTQKPELDSEFELYIPINK